MRSLSVIGGSDFFKISFKAEEDEEEDEDDDYDEKYKIMPRKDENNNNNNEENNRKNNEKSNDDEVKDNGGVKEPYKDVQKALKAVSLKKNFFLNIVLTYFNSQFDVFSILI